jgi:hypothetical protein
LCIALGAYNGAQGSFLQQSESIYIKEIKKIIEEAL